MNAVGSAMHMENQNWTSAAVEIMGLRSKTGQSIFWKILITRRIFPFRLTATGCRTVTGEDWGIHRLLSLLGGVSDFPGFL